MYMKKKEEKGTRSQSRGTSGEGMSMLIERLGRIKGEKSRRIKVKSLLSVEIIKTRRIPLFIENRKAN